jgi:hypothetical protein
MGRADILTRLLVTGRAVDPMRNSTFAGGLGCARAVARTTHPTQVPDRGSCDRDRSGHRFCAVEIMSTVNRMLMPRLRAQP